MALRKRVWQQTFSASQLSTMTALRVCCGMVRWWQRLRKNASPERSTTAPTRVARHVNAAAPAPAEYRGLARDAVRMLVATPTGKTHARFRDLTDHLRAGDPRLRSLSERESWRSARAGSDRGLTRV